MQYVQEVIEDYFRHYYDGEEESEDDEDLWERHFMRYDMLDEVRVRWR